MDAETKERKPASRPPGIIDKRQLLSAIDGAIDHLKRLREQVEQAFDGKEKR